MAPRKSANDDLVANIFMGNGSCTHEVQARVPRRTTAPIAIAPIATAPIATVPIATVPIAATTLFEDVAVIFQRQIHERDQQAFIEAGEEFDRELERITAGPAPHRENRHHPYSTQLNRSYGWCCCSHHFIDEYSYIEHWAANHCDHPGGRAIIMEEMQRRGGLEGHERDMR